MKEADQPDRYRGRYRVSSARLRGWDYGSNAAYFVTICVRDRSHAFGEICEGQMRFAPLGQAADACWRAIPDHFPFVVPDVHIVMPNHVHGIVVIDKQTASAPAANRFGPQSQNLASILRGFKIGVTKFASAQGLPFAWQARYHDHIIRNASEWERIRAYIVTNPARWSRDAYFG